VYRFGLPDEFVPQGDKKLLFQDLGLAPEQIAETLAQAVAKGKQS
jgi:deoxyxylulose-5-phosphate synthase